jgi:hypothetical protein
VVGYPPLVDMDDRQGREFHEALITGWNAGRGTGKAAASTPAARSAVSGARSAMWCGTQPIKPTDLEEIVNKHFGAEATARHRCYFGQFP